MKPGEPTRTSRALPPGLIYTIAAKAGIDVGDQSRPKIAIHCPLHDDRSPSAFLSSERNLFFCSVCTPEGGLSAKEFSSRMHVPWLQPAPVEMHPERRPTAQSTFGAELAQKVWELALLRTLDDVVVEEDRDVYDYLEARGLSEAWNERVLGIVSEGMALPGAIRRWPRDGYRIVAPLYDQRGEIVNLQARRIIEGEPKTLFPEGSRASGTVFANRLGVRLLRDHGYARDAVVTLGEGLTDHLGFSICCANPVLGIPGVAFAPSAIGEWARGRRVILAFDHDPAGESAVEAARAQLVRFGVASMHRLTWPTGGKDAVDYLEFFKSSTLIRELDRAVERDLVRAGI